MFKLKRVDLLGFKSFADRTRLEFADGIAGIVGPNGCGKSNLSDAISWVLGEQSARSLRGERMADVIFNGTGTRPSTGLAEVTLTLFDPELMSMGSAHIEPLAPENGDLGPKENAAAEGPTNGNSARRPALQHRAGEITVTRRLFRSGESEYLINGEVCRLRDIQDLFMGTGLGPESYAIIEQGRIGQILSSKPSDRRSIIEEAAGVSKYKTRKRLAEAKLESSRQNLARITDIFEEVTKQVGSLKRQASKARRYRELRDELRERLGVVLTSRLMALEGECGRLRAQLEALQAEFAAAAGKLEALEREQQTVTLRHDELENELTAGRESLAEGDLERERQMARLEKAAQQIAALDGRAAEAAEEGEALNTQIASLEREAAERARQIDQCRQDLIAAQETIRQLIARQEEMNAQVAESDRTLEARRQALLLAVSHAADMRNQLVQAEEVGLALDRQVGGATAERAALDQEHRRLAAENEALGAEHGREARSLEEFAQAAAETARALNAAGGEEAAWQVQLEALREEFSRATARQAALEESLARHAYSTEAVRRLLAATIPSTGHQFRPRGVLADFVEVSSGYEEVVEDFLKSELECVVVERHEEARSGIALLKSQGSGRSTFFVTQVPTNGHSNSHDGALGSAPGVIAPLRDLVRFEPRLGLNGDLALPALANAYLVEDAKTAQRLAGEHPEAHFLTPQGEHYAHRLVAGGKGPSAGPLALRRDFRELERRTAELAPSVRALEVAQAEVAARAAGLEEKLESLSARKLEAEKNSILASEKLRQGREALARAAERLNVVRSEAQALTSERQSTFTRQVSLRAQIEVGARERVRREEEMARTTQRLRELRAELDRLGGALSDAQARSMVLEERMHAVEGERARLLAQVEEARGRLKRLEEQRAAWRDEQRRLAEERTERQARLAELEAEQRAARQELRAREEEANLARSRRQELRPAIEAARAKLEARRERRSEIEIALTRAESDRAHHAHTCREDLNLEPAALLADFSPQTALAGEALAAAEDELREIKARLENLGPVNMMALEELQEAEERYSFLESQRQDLLVSIEDTAQAIREIDQVSRQQFLEAFHAVNQYFAESFRTLFGGGVGEMRLTDETDPDGGIDIVAQPPGKRLQNVLLLSGGEKAMAALALLIALFRYTPSPFCILDEVDAPLDESNIDRFTRLIVHMSRHTQFILITHNKRTMEIAQVLYGVTMEEPGVSRLVSVRFDEVAPEPVAVPA